MTPNIDPHLLSYIFSKKPIDFSFRYPIKIMVEPQWGTVAHGYIQGY